MGLPYFPMFPSDFEAKTSHLTLEEDGAYNRLLRLMWMTPGCSLPDDDAWIMRRMRVDKDTYERVVRVVIDEFCVRENGRVSNAKLTEVFEDTKTRHEKRVSAGSKGGKAKALKTNKTEPSNAKAMLKQPKPKPKPNLSTNVESDARERAAPQRKSKRATKLPDGWVPDLDKARRVMDEYELTREEMNFCYKKMEAHAYANGRTQKDWDAAYRNWVISEIGYGTIGPNSKQRKASASASIWD